MSVIDNLISETSIHHAKIGSILGTVTAMSLPIAVGLGLVKFGAKSIIKQIMDIFAGKGKHDFIPLDLKELISYFGIVIVLLSFSPLMSTYRASINYINNTMSPGSSTYARMQANYEKKINNQIIKEAKTRTKGVEASRQLWEQTVDVVIEDQANDQAYYNSLNSESTTSSMQSLNYDLADKYIQSGTKHSNDIKQLNEVSGSANASNTVANMKENEASGGTYNEGEGSWYDADLGTIMASGIHSSIQYIAGLVRKVMLAITKVGFSYMICFGPFAFALSVVLQNSYILWIKATLSLGLGQFAFNIMDNFMDVNIYLLASTETTMWESIATDFIMIVMYFGAYKWLGKIIGDPSGGALAGKAMGAGMAVGFGALKLGASAGKFKKG